MRGILSALPLSSTSITPMSTLSPVTSVSGMAAIMIDRRSKRKPKVKLAHVNIALRRTHPREESLESFKRSWL